MNTDSLDVPQSDAKDVAHIAVSTALSAIPFLGAGELFKFIVTPSLEKRREQWMENVAALIRELQQKTEPSLDDLKANEEFQTLLIEASQVALRTHLEDKRKRLIGVLKGNVEGKIPFDQASIRVRILDQLLPIHLQILHNIPVGVAYPQDTKAAAVRMLGKGLDPSISPSLLKTLVQDLQNLGVIRLRTTQHDDEPSYTYDRSEFGWL